MGRPGHRRGVRPPLTRPAALGSVGNGPSAPLGAVRVRACRRPACSSCSRRVHRLVKRIHSSLDTLVLNRFSSGHAQTHDQRRGPRRGRVQGCRLLRAATGPASRRRPATGSWRRRASWAGRPAPGPGRCRSPRRSRSAWWSPGRPRSSAPTPFFPSFIAGLETVLSAARPRAAAPGRRARADRAALPPAGAGGPRRRRLRHRPPRRRRATRAARGARPAGRDDRPRLGEQPRRAPVALGVDDAPGHPSPPSSTSSTSATAHRPRRRPAGDGARPSRGARPGARRSRAPGCPRAPASRPTSPPSPGARATGDLLDLRGAARPRSSTPTT